MNASTTTDTLLDFLTGMFAPGEVFEVRAPKTLDKPGGKFSATVSGYYADISAAARDIAALDSSGRADGIYVTLNPVEPSLLARSANRLKDRAAQTTADTNILRRSRMLIDIDPRRAAGISATDAELAHALDLAATVRNHLDQCGWPEPIETMSGNGAGLIYAIDLPTDDGGLVARVLKALAAQFNNEHAQIDESVHNAARISKAAGTMARKGDSLVGVAGVEDRPHRRSELLAMPDKLEPVKLALLEAVAAEIPTPAIPTPTPRPRGTNGTRKTFDKFPSTVAGVSGYLRSHGVRIIPLDAPPPPPLPDGIFTGWLGDMIYSVAAATETPPELAAMFALSTLSTAVQKKFSIRPEPGYFEPVNIFTLTAMVPGTRKTAVAGAITSPLKEWEKAKAGEVGAERRIAESKRKTAEGRIAEMRTRAKRMEGPEYDQLEAQIAELEESLPHVPVVPRLLFQDITPEHLGTMMAEQGERGAVISDEGGYFDTIAGRYSNGLANLDLLLQAHAGAFVRTDRGSRASVSMNHPALTMGLCAQPDVLAGLTRNRSFRGRGLLARFLYTIPVSRLGYRTLESRPVPEGVKSFYTTAITCLIDTKSCELDEHGEGGRPHVLRFNDSAYPIWKQWQRNVETMMRTGGRLEHVTDWGGKLPGATARLAALLHLADYATCATEVLDIDSATITRAILLSEFLLDHALIAFDAMGVDDGTDSARRLWREIQGMKRPTFSARDAWHPLRGTYKKVADVESGFATLLDHAFIAEIPTGDTGKPGRPGRRFKVNPRLLSSPESDPNTG